MIQNSSQNVLAAFDVLIEEIEDALRNMNKIGANALEVRDYDMAQKTIENARRILILREKVASLKGEWKDVEGAFSGQSDFENKTSHAASLQRQSSIHAIPSKPRPAVRHELPHPVGRLITGRISKGLRTPEPAFFRPILQALSDLGGSAKRSDVFSLLERSMRDVLKPIDYQTLSSESEQLRWQNSAQWARNLMVKEGLLQPDSPIGIWEITEQGRAWLMKNSR
jgi:restriction system protein